MLNLVVALNSPPPSNVRISALIHRISYLQVNVTGLVIAGSADFKSELSQSDMFDQVILSHLFLLEMPQKCRLVIANGGQFGKRKCNRSHVARTIRCLEIKNHWQWNFR